MSPYEMTHQMENSEFIEKVCGACNELIRDAIQKHPQAVAAFTLFGVILLCGMELNNTIAQERRQEQ